MLRSLYSGVTGLMSNQQSMDVIGNNIANVNTFGFKEGRAVFQDLFSQTTSGAKASTAMRGGVNPMQIGLGVRTAGVDNIFTIGSTYTSQKNSDLAIAGNGFFMVNSGRGSENYYTRAGDFSWDRDGTLVNPSGYKVQGWMASPDTGIVDDNGKTGDIKVGSEYLMMQPKPTSEITMGGILSGNAKGTKLLFDANLLTPAAATAGYDNLMTDAGTSTGLTRTSPVYIQAAPTGITDIKEISDATGQVSGIKDGDKMDVNVNGKVTVLTYQPVGGGVSKNDGTFTSLQDFADELENVLNSSVAGVTALATVEIKNGKLTVKNISNAPGATVPPANVANYPKDITLGLHLSGGSGGSFSSIFGPLVTGTITSGSKRDSADMIFRTNVKTGIDFSSPEQLAASIQGSINGNVSTAFKTEYLTNDFGMKNGETATMKFFADTTASGNIDTATQTLVTVAATYVDDESKVDTTGASGKFTFHTLRDLSVAMGNQINANAALKDHFGFNSQGKQLFVSQTSAGVGLGLKGVEITDAAGAKVFDGSSYLTTMMSKLDKQVYSGMQTANTEDITGTGRFIYLNSGSDMTGFKVFGAGPSTRAFSASMVTDPKGIDILNSDSAFSSQFMSIPTDNTKLTDLYTNQGTLGLNDGNSTIKVAGMVDGTLLTNNGDFTVQANSTLGQFLDFTEDYLGLGKGFNTRDNVYLNGSGQIVVEGEPGKMNSIDSLSISASPEKLHSSFINTFNGVSTTQKADGGFYKPTATIYDNMGSPYGLRFEYSLYNGEKNMWRAKVGIDDPNADLTLNGVNGDNVIVQFDENGNFNGIYDPNTQPMKRLTSLSLKVDPRNGSKVIDDIQVNLGTPGQHDGLVVGKDDTAATGVDKVNQNGYARGNLRDLSFDEGGNINATYSNGQNRAVGRLALATFTNNQGLTKVGDTLFRETINTGTLTINGAGVGDKGSLLTGKLENSNVDLSNEFVNMITTERGFQSNSRVITTSDEMIQEILSLKR